MIESKYLLNNKIIFFYLLFNIILLRLSNNIILNNLIIFSIYIMCIGNILLRNNQKKHNNIFINQNNNNFKKILKKIHLLLYNFPNIYKDLKNTVEIYERVYLDIEYLKKKNINKKDVRKIYKYKLNYLEKKIIKIFSSIKLTDLNFFFNNKDKIECIISNLINHFEI